MMKIKKNIAISESGFVFDPTSGESFSLNPIGIEIIDLLRQEKSFDEIREIMLNKYEVDDNSFEKYYYDFVSMLKQFKLIDENGEGK
ncbi:MAG: PqqD family peptide modification chaperone, partial [Bacteroidetes bacterium]|nr:PqqD family peptide modification chaperone [Bacteroidota bacterium]